MQRQISKANVQGQCAPEYGDIKTKFSNHLPNFGGLLHLKYCEMAYFPSISNSLKQCRGGTDDLFIYCDLWFLPDKEVAVIGNLSDVILTTVYFSWPSDSKSLGLPLGIEAG